MSILSNSSGEFVVINTGETQPTTYTDYNDIPAQVDAVVSFSGTVPEAPHSVNEHAEIQELYDAFDATMATSSARPATRIGDADVPHCSGMVRAIGSPTVFVNGIPWSRQGDVNTPHLLPAGKFCAIHAAPIATGSTTVRVNGLGAGRIGDAISGCTAVAAGSPNVFAGG
jgi:uncharacterized Zn-binding protein involved in type VI secretion